MSNYNLNTLHHVKVAFIVEHLLLYVDNNGDFIPDDYSDFLDGLSELELAEYNALKFEFETLVGDRLTSGYEYSDIVKEYNESLITDVDNEWKDLKAYGFKLRTEVLGTMDYTNIDNYDSDFGEATIELANKLLRPENSDEEYLYGNLVTSDFGVHKIKGIRNDDGVLPTAFYEETDPENPAFTVGNENVSVIPNQTQIDLFNQMFSFDKNKGNIISFEDIRIKSLIKENNSLKKKLKFFFYTFLDHANQNLVQMYESNTMSCCFISSY